MTKRLILYSDKKEKEELENDLIEKLIICQCLTESYLYLLNC